MKACTRKADKLNMSATSSSPEETECVCILSQPISAGLTKPARLPVQLINAMPAAAPAPPGNAVGSAQNMATAVTTPIAPRLSPSNAGTIWFSLMAQSTKPAAATSADQVLNFCRLIDHQLEHRNGNVILHQSPES